MHRRQPSQQQQRLAALRVQRRAGRRIGCTSTLANVHRRVQAQVIHADSQVGQQGGGGSALIIAGWQAVQHERPVPLSRAHQPVAEWEPTQESVKST